jgi:hypothetical protein
MTGYSDGKKQVKIKAELLVQMLGGFFDNLDKLRYIYVMVE